MLEQYEGKRTGCLCVRVVCHVFVIMILLCYVFIYYKYFRPTDMHACTHTHKHTNTSYVYASSFSCWAYCLVNPEYAAVSVACIILYVLR